MSPPLRILVTISGFLQRQAELNGLEKLWVKLHSQATCQARTIAPTPLPWNHDWSGFAEFLWRLRQREGRPLDLRVFCYSWGVGNGLVQLARQLGRRGMTVDAAVCCDPVYHSWLRPWRALFHSPPVLLPENVRAAWWLYQTKNRPNGSRGLVATPGADTVIARGLRIEATHQYADDSEAFHGLAQAVAAMGQGNLQEKAA